MNNNTTPVSSPLARRKRKTIHEEPDSPTTYKRIRANPLESPTPSPQILQIQQQDRLVRATRILSSLEKDQLVHIITSLVANNPSLEQEVASHLPTPTIQSVRNLLESSEKKLNETYPYSKWGPDRTSDYAFNRVRPHLTELCSTLLHYVDHFTNPSSYPVTQMHEYAQNSFTYLHLATTIVHRLPTWQTQTHTDQTKLSLYAHVGAAYKLVIAEVGRKVREEGKIYGATLLTEWGKWLHEHNAALNGEFGFGEAWENFRTQLGWLIGLYPAPTSVQLQQPQSPGHMHYPVSAALGLGGWGGSSTFLTS
ncbi:Tethering factor for nuclear proteasome sts1 [Rhizophlyctis rosea]|uniref:Tethering factor for nuclear proteasome STS1 n=1 Tax=Rhizophlyctis rosea TaxID=64517 RepID=A0AAD5X4E7_9FUNG|nr:Tethering factor for nuclear proteasome sts1 [Rhizophlyctis rosea]